MCGCSRKVRKAKKVNKNAVIDESTVAKDAQAVSDDGVQGQPCKTMKCWKEYKKEQKRKAKGSR